MPQKPQKQRARKSKTAGKRRQQRRRGRSLSDIARVKVLQNSYPIAANTMYSLENFALTNSTRASTVAQGYQFYRIKMVKVIFTAYADTFPANTSGQVGVPQLFAMIDKAGAISPTASLNDLKKMGAKPRRFDDKNIVYQFAPAILLNSNEISGGAVTNVFAGAYKVSPWLPTNQNSGSQTNAFAVNSVDHRGLRFFIQAQNYNATCGELSIEIEYEFKKPYWPSITSTTELTVIDVDSLGTDPEPVQVLSDNKPYPGETVV